MDFATQFELDREAGLPLGAQLGERLRGLVGEGVLRPGDQLPSVRQMANLAGVNVNTVRSVYAKLENDGVISSEHGRGTFVRGAERPAAEDREYRRELMRQIVELERQIAYYTRHQLVGAPEAPKTRPASQLLPATELIGLRDELQGRVQALRTAEEERLSAIAAEKAAVQEEELAVRAEEVRAAGRKSQATAATPPRILSAPGAWVLKWRA